MEQWPPTALFCAQYVVAGSAALCALLLSSRTLTLRMLIGWTGFYALVGGSFTPLCRELPLWPAAVTKAERTLFAAVSLGAGLVSLPALKSLATKMLTTTNVNGGKGGSDN